METRKQQKEEAHLVVHYCFRIIKHKLPVIAVYKAQERHQGDGDLGLDGSELRERYPVIPIHFTRRHDAPGLRSFGAIGPEGKRKGAGGRRHAVSTRLGGEAGGFTPHPQLRGCVAS